MNDEKIVIALIFVSFTGLRLECSCARTAMPGMIIAGASVYVGGLYYYGHLINSYMPKVIKDTVHKICFLKTVCNVGGLREKPATYYALYRNMQDIRDALLRETVKMGMFNRVIFYLFGGKEATLHNAMKEMCQQQACNIIDEFFRRRINALKSFHGVRGHNKKPKVWRIFYDSSCFDESSRHWCGDPSQTGSYLQNLQAALRQTFPAISCTYVQERYQQHVRDARQYGLVKHTASPEFFDPEQESARIVIRPRSLASCISEPVMGTVPVYYGDVGYKSKSRSGYQRYITVQDIAQYVRSLNITDYEHLQNRITNTDLISTAGDDLGYPFYIEDIEINLNAEGLPVGYRKNDDETVKLIKKHDALYKLPIHTIDERRELTYEIRIYPFEISQEL